MNERVEIISNEDRKRPKDSEVYRLFGDNKLLKKSKLSKTNIGSFENLYRNDDTYDFIIEIKSNNKPIIKNKGSAIFLHCSFSDLRPTKGCVALKKMI